MKSRPVLLGVGAALCLAGMLCAGWAWHLRPGPRALVAGGDAGGLPRSLPQSEHIDALVLERAAQDAAAHGLRAFVVMRNDHIVFERYGHGLTGESTVDSGAFAQALVALLSGTALQEGTLPTTALNGFDASRLRTAIETGARTPYATYLSRKLWRRLNAGPAWIELPRSGASAPADCCFHGRVLDWLRVAGLLLDDGRFEGTQVVPRGWVEHMLRPVSADGQHGFGVELGAPAQASVPFTVPGVVWLHGPGRWRLWLVPQLKLAVLFGADEPHPSDPPRPWDETRLLNLVIGTVPGQPVPRTDAPLLQQLVPGH